MSTQGGPQGNDGAHLRVRRYSGSARVNHWIVATTFVLLLLSGLSLFHPSLFRLSALFGGGAVVRWLHPWLGLILAVAFLGLFFRFLWQNLPETTDFVWLARIKHVAALAIWAKHAHAGVANAQAEIGRCFANGWGVARDTALAERWLTLAAQAGDAVGQSLLGDFHFNGESGAPDRVIAEEWYARAARQGDADAQDMLSWILTDGDHRKPDYSQAMQWALKAAEQGVAASMTRIGLLHNNALGVERNVNAAARWWRKAALLGDAGGQAMLGAAHHLGAGVDRDPVAALAVYTTPGAATWLAPS
jgi:hypothetical protein